MSCGATTQLPEMTEVSGGEREDRIRLVDELYDKKLMYKAFCGWAQI